MNVKKSIKSIFSFTKKKKKRSISLDKYECFYEDNDKKKLIKERIFYVLWFLLPGLIFIGIHLFLIDVVNTDTLSPFVNILIYLLKDFGGVLLAIGLITIGYEITVNRKLYSNIDRLKFTIKDLQDTVSIASGAIDSGLSAVYTTREESKNAIREFLEQLISDENKTDGDIEIKLLGISLGDYLCPHGGLHSIFRELVQLKNIKISLLILEDRSNSALTRALREEPHKFPKDKNFSNLSKDPEIIKAYDTTRCHDELKTATDFLKDLLFRKKAQEANLKLTFAPSDSKPILANLYCATYDYSPMAFILILDEIMFIENYHLAGRGGEAPMLRISKFREGKRDKRTRLFGIYEEHYEVIKYKMSKKIEPEQ